MDFTGNIERFSGFAGLYDRYRPAPPELLGEVLVRLAAVARPRLVVDLGSGTGLSTRYWADRADEVIGIDPTGDMRRQAEARSGAANVTYREGFSHATGLPSGHADVVTCAQALHWMEPEETFREAARILRPGGVFAAFDYDWPPETGCWEADAAFEDCWAMVRSRDAQRRALHPARVWDKAGHLERMRASGRFRYVREIVMHHVDRGNAERLVGLLLSQGSTMSLLKEGVSEETLGIDALRAVAERTLGAQPSIWFWSSRLRVGII